MKIKIRFALIALALSCQLQGQQSKIAETRQVLNQWVETKQVISETKSEWQLERSILENSEKLLIRELERLDAELKVLNSTATAADTARAELAEEKERLEEAAAVVIEAVAELEVQTRTVVRAFPEPLVETLKPLLRRLPSDSSETKLSLGERVQNIVGILSQADKFNGMITQTSETRELEDGRVIEVRTLYWGLGGAYYVDATGEYAGVGVPGDNGWEWSKVDEAGAQIKRLFEVYEGSKEIQFVEIPVTIK